MSSIKLIALVILMSTTVAQASLYRWVDENGKVHFSDRVPPSRSQQGHTALNKNGLESGHVSSAAELKAEHNKVLQKQELEVEKTEAKLAEEEKKRLDDQLLAIYASREEIITTYQKKISLVNQSIGILSARDESLTQKLIRLEKQRKASKEEMARLTLKMQIENTQESLQDYRKAIVIKRADHSEMMAKYRETLIRFDQITQVSK